MLTVNAWVQVAFDTLYLPTLLLRVISDYIKQIDTCLIKAQVDKQNTCTME